MLKSTPIPSVFSATGPPAAHTAIVRSVAAVPLRNPEAGLPEANGDVAPSSRQLLDAVENTSSEPPRRKPFAPNQVAKTRSPKPSPPAGKRPRSPELPHFRRQRAAPYAAHPRRETILSANAAQAPRSSRRPCLGPDATNLSIPSCQPNLYADRSGLGSMWSRGLALCARCNQPREACAAVAANRFFCCAHRQHVRHRKAPAYRLTLCHPTVIVCTARWTT